jgi:arylsulfatase A-like enzyme
MRPPNMLLLITDQQRRARHWPEDPGWLRALMPNEAELARTGLTFRNGFCDASMCSPSRATLLTGLYPARHGVTLTLTAADLRPDPRHGPAVVASLARLMARPGAPRRRALRQFARGALRLGPPGGGEPELSAGTPNLARMLRAAGYEVAYKGKWHLTQPVEASGWSARDAEALEERFGFAGWEPPDAGENAKAENFGGGIAGPLGEGWDEVYTSQAEAWLGQAELPEPFCLVVSLVNPHDVLGYASSFRQGGYEVSDFREMGVALPPTIDEDLTGKPTVHTLMQMGMTAYLGPLRGRRAQLDYVNFYAYLHRLVDAKIGRVLAALGDPGDPGSLRSRTVVVRCSDHGEMGLSHGGLRQKAFNAYEETIHVPMVVSNPVLFPRPAETGALASLIDVLPTMATLGGAEPPAGAQGTDLSPVLARHAAAEREALERSGADLRPVVEHPAPAASVREVVHFSYDDHQAGTAQAEAPGQPNRVRCIRDSRMKYAAYLDPQGRVEPEYEMYDLERDPEERVNLLDHRTGEPRAPSDRAERDRLAEALRAQMAEFGTGL